MLVPAVTIYTILHVDTQTFEQSAGRTVWRLLFSVSTSIQRTVNINQLHDDTAIDITAMHAPCAHQHDALRHQHPIAERLPCTSVQNASDTRCYGRELTISFNRQGMSRQRAALGAGLE